MGRFFPAMDAALEAITNGRQSPKDALDGAAARMLSNSHGPPPKRLRRSPPGGRASGPAKPVPRLLLGGAVVVLAGLALLWLVFSLWPPARR
jgi:hypothetical protein